MDPCAPEPVPPPPDYASLGDAELVQLAVHAQVWQNAQHARRLRAFGELHERCARDHKARRAAAEHVWFVLTPGEETGLEFATALGITPTAVQGQLNLYHRLSTQFPHIWSMCERGRLDLGKAGAILDAAETIAEESDVARFAEAMAEFFTRHDDPDAPLVTLTRDQIQKAARYRKLKFRQKDDEEKFSEAFAKRRARLRFDDNGLGWLSCSNMGTELAAADHRLTLLAKKLCEHDEQGRTLEQMRADVMVDLLLGRLEVGALTSELEEDETVDGEDPISLFHRRKVGAFARPVILATVPLSTLMGAGDEPGLLSGDIPLPADVVRRIADDPGSTWYRMLTDEAGELVHLSTKSYSPTPPIVRAVTGRDRTCVWVGCSRPATQCQLDHRVPHPEGATCVCNLWPLCARHHKAKHSDAFTLTLDGETITVTSRRGTKLTGPRNRQPVDPLLIQPEAARTRTRSSRTEAEAVR